MARAAAESAHEATDTLDGEVDGEREERHADQSHAPGFAVFTLAAQLPDHDAGRAELDHRVQAEPDQRDR